MIGLKGYKCPRWYSTYHNGDFDEAGYDIDHIEEYCITQDHSLDNLQALCKSCHSVKTKRFMSGKKHTKKKGKGVREMDIYERFLDECTEEMDGYNVSINDVYDCFKEWIKDNHIDDCPGKRTMTGELRKYIKIKKLTVNKGWHTGIQNLNITYFD